MTPAERDEVRGIAAMRACCELGAGVLVSCGSDTCVMARAILRYVPPGVVAPSLLFARANVNGAITFDGGICTAESARRIAAEFNAAADAAGES